MADPETQAAGTQAPARPEPRPVTGRRRLRLWQELLLFLLLAAVLTVTVKTFVVQAFRIPTGSMGDTLQIGDRVLVNRFVYRFRDIDRGDIVVFSGQGSWDRASRAGQSAPAVAAYHWALQAAGLESRGTDYVKRVIGLPGDQVACCNARGWVTVNGVPLDERSYLYPGDRPSADRFRVTVPPGRLWVMGDHRGDSSDSRYHSADPGDGTIPENAVIGRAFVVIWPPAHIRSLPIPGTFARIRLFARPRLAVAGPLPALAATAGVAGMLPLAWACRRLRARLSDGPG